MPFRFHRSLRILPGVRLNVSKSGLGLSSKLGPLTMSTGPRGSRKTVNLPGTGLSYTSSTGRRKSTRGAGGGSGGCCLVTLVALPFIWLWRAAAWTFRATFAILTALYRAVSASLATPDRRKIALPIYGGLIGVCLIASLVQAAYQASPAGRASATAAAQTLTAIPTNTVLPSNTPLPPTRTSTITSSPTITRTPLPTWTAAPTETPRPTYTATLAPVIQPQQPAGACDCNRDWSCGDFNGNHAAAQACFESCGGSPDNNVFGLDRDHDGIACEN